ncbi:MAG: inorganic pyrophosphatase [Crocinitomicaceae bacterium]|nr:inorganic pyrophosphatase [Crocinitomicaceae bacterium]
MSNTDKLIALFEKRFAAHPWHGIEIGEKSPEVITSYIEINPNDQIKYELDKDSGLIIVDRPQKYSNIVPALYGFVPQTYCDKLVAEYCMEKSGLSNIEGDGDPLDIIVLTERNITRGNILVDAIPVGGFRMIDGGEADDKIIAVLKGDQAYGNITDIDQVPSMVLDRVKHFFLTYKENPNKDGSDKEVEITHTYNKAEAHEVIRRSFDDYVNIYGNVKKEFEVALNNFVNA